MNYCNLEGTFLQEDQNKSLSEHGLPQFFDHKDPCLRNSSLPWTTRTIWAFCRWGWMTPIHQSLQVWMNWHTKTFKSLRVAGWGSLQHLVLTKWVYIMDIYYYLLWYIKKCVTYVPWSVLLDHIKHSWGMDCHLPPFSNGIVFFPHCQDSNFVRWMAISM